MKKIFFLLLLITSLLSCVNDNSDYYDRLDDLEDRVTIIEECVVNINKQIENIETIITILENNDDYIIRTEPVLNNSGKEIGYRIIFHTQDPIVIYHGEDGINGEIPIVGTKLFEGRYYWTTKIGENEEEFILDDMGAKIPTSGGDTIGITPIIKAMTNDSNDGILYWAVSKDNGVTFEFLMDGDKFIPADGKDGGGGTGDVKFFKKVIVNTNSVTFIFQNGEKMEIPLVTDLKIQIETGRIDGNVGTININGSTDEIRIKYSRDISNGLGVDYSIISAVVKKIGADFGTIGSSGGINANLWTTSISDPVPLDGDSEWSGSSTVTVQSRESGSGVLVITVVDIDGSNLCVVSCPIKSVIPIPEGYTIETNNKIGDDYKSVNHRSNFNYAYNEYTSEKNVYSLKITGNKSFTESHYNLILDNFTIIKLSIESQFAGIIYTMNGYMKLAGSVEFINLPTLQTIMSNAYGAFESCKRLKTINIPMATTIGMYTFGECLALKDIRFGEIETIYPEAFNAYNKTFPNSHTVDSPLTISVPDDATRTIVHDYFMDKYESYYRDGKVVIVVEDTFTPAEWVN